MTRILQDVQFAFRSFRRSPVFTSVAVLSLALGIGANTAIFTLVDQLILRLLPVQDPDRIVLLAGNGRHYGGNNGRNATAYPTSGGMAAWNLTRKGMRVLMLDAGTKVPRSQFWSHVKPWQVRAHQARQRERRRQPRRDPHRQLVWEREPD